MVSSGLHMKALMTNPTGNQMVREIAICVLAGRNRPGILEHSTICGCAARCAEAFPRFPSALLFLKKSLSWYISVQEHVSGTLHIDSQHVKMYQVTCSHRVKACLKIVARFASYLDAQGPWNLCLTVPQLPSRDLDHARQWACGNVSLDGRCSLIYVLQNVGQTYRSWPCVLPFALGCFPLHRTRCW